MAMTIMQTTAPKPETENDREIHTLTLESDRLGKSIDRFNDEYVWLGALALLVALGVFLAQFLIIRKGRALSTAQTALLSAKDRKLKADLATAKEESDQKILALQKSASDALAAQQKVQVSLARQEEKTAVAQHDLLKLQEQMKHRTISNEQRRRFLKLTAGVKNKGPVNITALGGDPEAVEFAKEIRDLLFSAGWPKPTFSEGTLVYNQVGLALMIQSVETLPQDPIDHTKVHIPETAVIYHAVHISEALTECGIVLTTVSAAGGGGNGNWVNIVVGRKP